jgi:hypothetical protein
MVNNAGTWTGALRALAAGSPGSATLEVKLDGPYGLLPPFSDRTALVLFAGGMGIAPLHSLFADVYICVLLGTGVRRLRVCSLPCHVSRQVRLRSCSAIGLC